MFFSYMQAVVKRSPPAISCPIIRRPVRPCLATDENEIAAELNQAFSNIFTREDIRVIPDPEPMRLRTKLTSTFITSE